MAIEQEAERRKNRGHAKIEARVLRGVEALAGVAERGWRAIRRGGAPTAVAVCRAIGAGEGSGPSAEPVERVRKPRASPNPG